MSTELLFSTNNLVGVGPMRGITNTLEQNLVVANQAGIEKVELAVTRTVARRVDRGEMSREEQSAIGAVGQSFRGEPTLLHTLAASLREPKRAMLMFGAYLTYPYILDSNRTIMAIQADKPDVTAVMQPPLAMIERSVGVKNASVVVSPDLMRDARVKNCDDLGKTLQARGVRLCIDPVQLRRRDVNGNLTVLSNLDVSIPTLMTHASLVHLSLGRNDLSFKGVDTVAELRDVYEGRSVSTAQTPIIRVVEQIADSIHQSGVHMPITLQIPYTGVSHIVGRLPSYNDVVQVVSRVATNLRSILG